MPITQAPAESLAATVKHDLQNPSSASQRTLDTLRVLLDIDVNCNNFPEEAPLQKKKPESRITSRSNLSAGKPRATGRRGKPDFQVHDGGSASANLLPQDQKRVLATEAFNISLKCLTQKVKENQNGTGSQTAQVTQSLTSTQERALVSRSPNRGASGPQGQKSGSLRKNIRSVCGPKESLEVLGQCAIVALQYLNVLSHTSNTAGFNPNEPLIRGGQILLDKLIGLGLTAQAIDQLWLFRQQLNSLLMGKTCKSKNKPALSSAMAFTELPQESGLLKIIMSFQLQVMKIGSLVGSKYLDEGLLKLLDDSNPGALLAQYSRAVEAKYIPNETAGQFIHSLSSILAKMCTSIRGKSLGSITPILLFQWNTIALRLRCQSWKLLGHKPELEKEMWSPLAIALRSYRESVAEFQISESLCVKEIVADIRNLLAKIGQRDGPLPMVANILVDIFQRSNLMDDALALLPDDETGHDDQDLTSIINRCRAATIVLGDARSDTTTRLKHCEKALIYLKLPSKGTATDLKDLLLWTARLRKSALAVALSLERKIESCQVDEDDLNLQTRSIQVVCSIMTFMIKCFGQFETHSNKSVSEETNTAIYNSARNTVDSILAIMKFSNIRTILPWPETEAALIESLRLARLIEDRNTAGAGLNEKKFSASFTCLKVSNIYWVWYLHEKENSHDFRSLHLLLERSLEALEQCSVEDRLAGFEIVKRERLASTYMAIGQTEMSKSELALAIKTAITQGALDEAVEIVLSKPAEMAWTDTKLNTHILGSCLRKFGKISVHVHDQVTSNKTSFFDDESLAEIHRAQILEMQLYAIAELRQNLSTKAIVTTITTRILDLCQQPQYHVYRIRFIRDLLMHSAKHSDFPIHDILNDELLQTACSFHQTHARIPCFLAGYGPMLCVSVLLQWAFLSSRPSLQCVRTLVESCGSLLSQCTNSNELEGIVDDPESLLRQLAAAADYAGMLDSADIRLAALRLSCQVIKLQREPNMIRLANSLVEIGKTLTRLGDTFDAGRSFAEAERLLDLDFDNGEARLVWCLAYSSYLTEIEAFEKACVTMRNAQRIYVELFEGSPRVRRDNHRLKQDHYLGFATLIASKIAFHHDDLGSAISHARKSIKLTTGLWVALENIFEGVQNSLDSLDLENSHNTEESLNTALSKNQSGLQAVVKGVPYWIYIDLHFQALLHVSFLSAHCGLYPDAIYYAGLASKLSGVLTSQQRQATSKVKFALLHAKAGQHAQLSLQLKGMMVDTLDYSTDVDALNSVLDLASAALAINDIECTSQYLDKAKIIIAKRFMPENGRISSVHSNKTTSDKRLKESTLSNIKTSEGSNSRKTMKAQVIPAKKGRNADSARGSALQSLSSKLDSQVVSPIFTRLQDVHDTISLQLQVLKAKSSPLVEPRTINLLLVSASSKGSKKLVEATLLLNQALLAFGSDAVHCVLAETALAYPSRYHPRRPSGRVSALSATTVSAKAKKTLPKSNTRRHPGIGTPLADQDGPLKLLQSAYDLICSASNLDIDQSSSETVHGIQQLCCRLSMLANAVGLSFSYSPIRVVNDSLKSKDVMLLREGFVADVGQPLLAKSELRRWPSVNVTPAAIQIEAADQTQILSSLVGSLPETWTVVSISLNESQTEMLLSRIAVGTTPLILRIPLARSAIDDADDGEFTFLEAKDELMSIINEANKTAHDSRSQAEKAARKVWWAEREALDHRLETLLLNIENIWLGGFRGVLSQQERSDAELLSRFSSSLDVALEKHLPSRQKNGRTSVPRVQLHAHILDLFVSLGHPDEGELDDAVTDLLYFVVDILQFEGERNAYDEIDFDAMLVDVLDAIQSYHEACPKDPTSHHTILILDKELHAFPWESMPCLLNKSVSRMPSLSMVHERLLRIQAQASASQHLDAYCIASTNGAYVLNPSSDLSSTQLTFSAPFTQQLPTYTAITSRPPSESELVSFLSSKELFLYFGHGSGAQYIRGRQIKGLDRCAVTFLMGCSSSRMVECGAFESHGPPWNYMHARSMAVVGTLWDVTDRDIDRFALACFDEWGLLHEVGEDEKDRKKTEARKKKIESKNKKQYASRRAVKKDDDRRKGKGQVALDEALNRARDACILRYLNGAAVVMYGLPVMLE